MQPQGCPGSEGLFFVIITVHMYLDFQRVGYHGLPFEIESVTEMARKANLDFNTLKKAMSGKTVSPRTARALALAISSELGQTIRIQDISDLQVK
jgi:hypothetical protein